MKGKKPREMPWAGMGDAGEIGQYPIARGISNNGVLRRLAALLGPNAADDQAPNTALREPSIQSGADQGAVLALAGHDIRVIRTGASVSTNPEAGENGPWSPS